MATLRGRLREALIRRRERQALKRGEELPEDEGRVAEARRIDAEYHELKFGRKKRLTREEVKEVTHRIQKQLKHFRAEREAVLGRFRGERRAVGMKGRRLREITRERIGLSDLRDWSRGEDNRYIGRHAPQWGSGAFGDRPKSKHHRSPRKKKKPWFEGKGLW